MLKSSVDMSGERFGDKVGIAHLAQFSFSDEDSDCLNIYRADAILHRDWKWEIENIDMEYALGVRVTFKDGSVLNVSAWADCCDGSGCRACEGNYRL